MARRIGFYSIKYHAHLLCKFIAAFTPVIVEVFPNATALHAALAAANAACQTLTQQIAAVEAPGV